MKTLGVILLTFIAPVLLHAQNIDKISGKVASPNGEPLVGNAIVLSAQDSAFIKGASFINGNFELTGVNRAEVLLKLSSLQFADTVIQVKYAGKQDINLGTILIKQSKFGLNEVVVTSRAPLTRQLPNGNIEVNVANTVLATSSNVNEILSRSPNVIVSDEGISLFGKGNAIIYLNGRRISAEQMAAIPVSQIMKIEIIGNPSSKYDAEGKAVIDIKTKSNADEGILGSLSQQVTASDFFGVNAQSLLDLNYRKGKVAMIGSYNLLLGKDREILNTTRTRPKADEYLSSDLETEWKRKLKNYSNYSLGLQYDISERSNVSLEYNGNLEDLGGSQDSKNALITNSENSIYTSAIDVKRKRTNHSGRLNYNHTTDSMGSSIFIGSQYSRFDSKVNDFIDEASTINTEDTFRFLNNKIAHEISISTSQVDYTKVFEGNRKLSLGAKFSYVNTSSDTRFFIGPTKEHLIINDEMSNNFSYIEKIPAAYASYSGVIGRKLNFEAGLRGEWTFYKLNTSVQGGRIIDDSYLNVFPNLGINTNLSNNMRLRAAYAARITRPGYQSLNPFSIYQDPFTTTEGNPNLVPEKTHAFEVGLSYKKIDLTSGYTYAIDPLDASALRGDDEKSYVLKPINLDKSHAFFATLSTSFTERWWTSTTSVNVRYTKLIDDQFDFKYTTPKPQVYLYTNNTFNVNNLFKVNLLAWYLGNRYNGLFYRQDYAMVTMGVEKDLFNKKLTLKFLANDIFNTFKLEGDYSVGTTDVWYRRDFGFDYFRMIVTYNFGKLKKTNYKNKATGQTENNRAN